MTIPLDPAGLEAAARQLAETAEVVRAYLAAAGRAAATPDPPDEAAIRADERERLSARVYKNGWCPTCGTKTADPGVIPGPDPGACPACGGWRKAGMIHRCPPGATPEDERARIGAEERKRITDLLRDGAARRELRANRPGNAAATTLMASWEALRLAADVIERSAGSAGSDGEDR